MSTEGRSAMYSTSRLRLLVVAVIGSLVAAMTAGLLSPTSASGAAAPQGANVIRDQAHVGKNYRLDPKPGLLRGDDAPGLAVNPRNNKHIVELNTDLPHQTIEHHVSFNGGKTWSDGGELTAPEGFPKRRVVDIGHGTSAFDSSVVFGSGNNVYTAFAAVPDLKEGEQQQGQSALVARSTNGGRTFKAGVVALRAGPASQGPEYYFPKLAISRKGGKDKLYLVAGERRANPTPGGARLENTVLSVSEDGGSTWSPARQANAEGQAAIEQSQPALAKDGSVVVTWRTRGKDGEVIAGKSLDDGRTWLRYRIAEVKGYEAGQTAEPPYRPGQAFTASTFPRLAADPTSGALYTVYGDRPQPRPAPFQANDHFINPDMDVYFSRSLDQGLTWSLPKVLNDDNPPPGTVVTQTRHPNVSVAPNGRVDVIWHDRRHWYRGCFHTHTACKEARLGDTYYTFSNNKGQTFGRNIRVTQRSTNNDVGYDYRFGTYWDFGPVSVPLGNNKVLAAWMDSRQGNFDTDNQDIFLAQINVGRAGKAAVQKVGAGDPINASIDLSRFSNPGGSEAVLTATFATRAVTRVVIANKADAARALAGSVLARGHLGPLLLAPRSGLTKGLKKEIQRMNPIGAYVLGDEGSLSPNVETQLADLGIPADQVQRLDGGDVFGTAKLIAENLDRRKDAEKLGNAPAFDAVVIANPNKDDAAAAAGLAAARRLPYLFVKKDSVPQATEEAIQSLDINKALVIGGPKSVSNGVEADLPNATRLGGKNAYDVSKSVIRESLDRGLPANTVLVVDGSRPVLGALAGRAAGRVTALELLVKGGSVSGARKVLGNLGLRDEVDRIFAVKGAKQKAAKKGKGGSRS